MRATLRNIAKKTFLFFGLVLYLAVVTPALAAERQIVKGHVPRILAQLNPIRDLESSRLLHLSIGLPIRQQGELNTFLEQLRDPDSPQYRHYLTPKQFAQRFSPTGNDYEALKAFVQANGLKVTGEHTNRLVLDVQGDVATVEKALHLRLQLYRHPTENRNFFAPNVEPSMNFALPVTHISGLDDYSVPHPNYKFRPAVLRPQHTSTPATGSGTNGTYAGRDFRAAYVPGTALNGAGQALALLEFDGFYANDIYNYVWAFSLPTVPVNVIPVSGGISTPGTGNIEVALDIEMAIAMAPGLSNINVYEAPNDTASWDSVLSRIADDNNSKQISCSWLGGSPDSTAEQIFQQMAAQGQSFFVSSGDSDAYTGSLPFPSDSPNITVVGGTTLTTTGPGGSYVSETAWNWGYVPSANEYEGSSGGASTYYSIPNYQVGTSMASNQGSTTNRNIPDVALTADNIFVFFNGGSAGSVGGTSCAAPLWAGFMALVNQQAVANGAGPVGFLNPTLYKLGNSQNYASNFQDITSGNNFWASSPAKFSAVPGYDLCTGWGTPAGTTLINTLGGKVLPRQAPEITDGPPTATAYADDFYSFTFGATGNPIPTFALTSGQLPPGLTLSSDGTISGTPTLAGQFTSTVTASNGILPNAMETFTITVPQRAPLIVNGPPPSTAFTGVDYLFSYVTIGLPVPTFSLSSGKLPPGLTLSSTGKLSGTPSSTGNFTAVVTASNGVSPDASQTLTISVSPPAGVLSILHSFASTGDAQNSNSGLVQGRDGNLYGTSWLGGTAGSGGIFKISLNGTETLLHSFGDGSTPQDGLHPYAGLTQASDGNFYGTTYGGGANDCGTVFKMTTSGTVTILHSFGDGSVVHDGQYPYGGLTQASDGNLYGTTWSGGAAGFGSIFKITTKGVVTLLHSFSDGSVLNDGHYPYAGLIQATDGNFYSTTSEGGSKGNGTVYKVTTRGAVTILHNFGDGSVVDDGQTPYAGLVQATDGNLYGTTSGGGGSSYGTVFKITTKGVVSILHSFEVLNYYFDGYDPEGALIQATDGALYGTTSVGGTAGDGAVFKITPSGVITFIHNYGDGTIANDGIYPYAPLTQGSDGNLYGTTFGGGSAGVGTIFKVEIPIVIKTAPASQTVTGGQSATFSVVPVGVGPFTYQWYFNGVLISGATSATYTVLSATKSGTYTVVVHDANNLSTTVTATLVVVPNPTDTPTMPQWALLILSLLLCLVATRATGWRSRA